LNPLWSIADWTFDPAGQRLSRGPETVSLPQKVSEVLRTLAESQGEVVTREALIASVWRGNSYTGGRGLTNAIWQLRRHFDGEVEDRERQSAIETISRSGYRLRLNARRLEVGADAPVYAAAVEPKPQQADALGAVSEPAASAVLPRSALRGRMGAWVLATAAVAIAVLIVMLRPFAPSGSLEAPAALERRSMTVLDGAEEYPAVSRDGRWLAFMWERPGHPARVMIASADRADTGLRDVSVGALDEARPTWSPDGQRLALIRLGGPSLCELRIRDIDSLQDTVVASCFYERLHQVYDWSPDGRTMAIARSIEDGGTVGIVLHDLDTGEERTLTTPPAGEQDSQLAFSPDGRSIAFVRRSLSIGELHRVDIDTGVVQTLTDDKAPIYGLAWRADGHGIVFNSMREGRYALWQVAPDGGSIVDYAAMDTPFNLATLPTVPDGVAVSQHRSAEHIEILEPDARRTLTTLSSAGRDMYAQWSPVNGRLMFLSTRGGNLSLWGGNADGSDVRQLPQPDAVPNIPAWSPVDGRYAASLHPKGATHESIYLAASEDAPLQPLIDDGHDYATVSWLPDGSGLLVGSNRDGGWALWRYDFEGARLSRLTDVPAMYGQMDAEGRLYYSRRDRAGLWLHIEGQPDREVLAGLDPDDWGNWNLANGRLYAILRDPEQDRLQRCDAEGQGCETLATWPRNAIRYYRSLSIAPDGRIVLTMLGRRQSDIVALVPLPASR